MMTIDDEGEGGVFGPMMTSSQKSNFLANFGSSPGIFLKFSTKFSNSPKFKFPKIFKFRKNNSKI